MRVGLVCRGGVDAFQETHSEEKADILIFGFEGIGEVSYERELKGETRFFEDAALLSKTAKNVVVCGCVTDTRGHKRKSALVAECGKLSGVSDMLHAVDGEAGSGAALRIYDTKSGKMGVEVDGDLRFPSVIKALAVCGSDFIVCPCERIEEMHSVLARAHAYCYGVPIFLCGNGYAAIASGEGKIAFATPQSPAFVDFCVRKEYHLVETRRRFVHGSL